MNMSFVGLIRKTAVERRSATAKALLGILTDKDSTVGEVTHRIITCENQTADFKRIKSEKTRAEMLRRFGSVRLSISKTDAERLLRFVDALKLRNPTMPHIIATTEVGGWRPLIGGGHVRHMQQHTTY